MFTLPKEVEEQIKKRCDEMTETENEIALEWYGIPFDELNEDEKETCTFEMQDRLGIGG